jgi:hypothetical protein
MDVLPEQNAGSTIELRKDDIAPGEFNFDLMWRMVGKFKDDDIAGEIGMHPKTVARARKGIVGEDFIANTLTALGKREHLLTMCNLEPSFEKVFRIVPVGGA